MVCHPATGAWSMVEGAMDASNPPALKEVEPNNQIGQATKIAIPQQVNGHIFDESGEDFDLFKYDFHDPSNKMPVG